MRLFALAVALVGFAGCLEVDSPDGTLVCSTVPKRACPEGFYCLAADNRCWRYGHFPTEDMADPFQFPQFPGDDLSIPRPDDLSMTDDSGTTLPDDLSQTD